MGNTIQQQSEELVDKFIPHTKVFHEVLGWEEYLDSAKQCAIICCQYIINANPHSNPLNTDVYSTIEYWQQVKNYIKDKM